MPKLSLNKAKELLVSSITEDCIVRTCKDSTGGYLTVDCADITLNLVTQTYSTYTGYRVVLRSVGY